MICGGRKGERQEEEEEEGEWVGCVATLTLCWEPLT